MCTFFKYQLLTIFLFLLFANAIAQTQPIIRPGEIWPDNKGEHVQAHGGGIIKVGKNYFWYGEDRRQGLDTNFRYVSCYTSTDLVNWEYKGNALKASTPDTSLGNKWVLERPKVITMQKRKNM